MSKSIKPTLFFALFLAFVSCNASNKGQTMGDEKRKIKSTRISNYEVRKVAGEILKGELFDDSDYSLYNEKGKLTQTGRLDYSFAKDCFTRETTYFSYNDKDSLTEKEITTSYHRQLKAPAQDIYTKEITKYNYNKKGNCTTEVSSTNTYNFANNKLEQKVGNSVTRYTYNEKGKCIKKTDGTSTATIEYGGADGMGKIVRISKSDIDSECETEEIRRYDEDNNLSEKEEYKWLKDDDSVGNRRCVSKKVFNKQGDCILEWEQDYSAGSTSSTVTFEYEYDKDNNWIRQISYQHHDKDESRNSDSTYTDEDPYKRVLRIYEREIEYYSENDYF